MRLPTFGLHSAVEVFLIKSIMHRNTQPVVFPCLLLCLVYKGVEHAFIVVVVVVCCVVVMLSHNAMQSRGVYIGIRKEPPARLRALLCSAMLCYAMLCSAAMQCELELTREKYGRLIQREKKK